MAGTTWLIKPGRRGVDDVTEQGTLIMSVSLPFGAEETIRFPNGEIWKIVPDQPESIENQIFGSDGSLLVTLERTTQKRRSMAVHVGGHTILVGRTGGAFSMLRNMEAVDASGQQLAALTETGQFRVRRTIVFHCDIPRLHQIAITAAAIILRDRAASQAATI